MPNANSPECDIHVYQNVEVDITPCTGPLCNAGLYNVSYNGKPRLEIPVYKRNTIIRFGLSDATAPDVYFVGMTTSLGRANPQLSSYSISVDRRVLICTDAHSSNGRFDVTLEWIIGMPLSHDPQVHNKPG